MLYSKIDPVITSRSLALITAPARASLMCSTVTMDRMRPSISNIEPLRKSFVLINEELHCVQVTVETEAGDDTARRPRGHPAGAELLAGVDGGDVHLHDRQAKGLQTIVEGQRIVRQRSRVDDHAVGARSLLLQEVDDLALAVALKDRHLDLQLARLVAHHLVQVDQRPGAVDVRLALAEEVQVRPVDGEQLPH